MNRLIVFGLAVTFGAANLVMRPVLANPPVELQPTSPGVTQVGHLNISGTAISKVVRAESIFGNSITATGTASGGDFRSASTSGRGLYGLASASSGLTYGGFFQNQSSTGRAVYGLATNTSSTNYGGYFQAAGSSGRGAFGAATAITGNTFGGYFTNASSTGVGVYGVATSASGTTYGVYGLANSPDGYAGYFDGKLTANGDLFAHQGTFTGIGFSAPGVVQFGIGRSIGIDDDGHLRITSPNQGHMVFSSSGQIGIGDFLGTYPSSFTGKVFVLDSREDSFGTVLARNGGVNTGGFGVKRRAIYAEAVGPGGSSGVTAIGQSSTGTSYGVEGYALGGQASNYGIYGYAANGAANYAGYFSGLLYANSSSAGVKSFLIDHPQDPENKFLEHSSIESDQRMDVYRGVVTTDPQGYADIAMPGWFSSLNEDIQYQLTIVDTKDSSDFVLAKVVKKYDGRTFRIRTSAPKIEVNWLVSGVRHDQSSLYLPLVVERDKKPNERGRYLLPEAFGKDRSYAMEAKPKEKQNKPPLKQK